MRHAASSYVLLGLTVILALTAMPAALIAGARPQPGQIVLVIAPPWASGGAAEVVARAGGREVGPQRAPMAVLAVLEAPQVARDQGAWLVLDGRLIARVCGVSVDVELGNAEHV